MRSPYKRVTGRIRKNNRQNTEGGIPAGRGEAGSMADTGGGYKIQMIKFTDGKRRKLYGKAKRIAALCMAGMMLFTPAMQVQAVGAGSSIARGIDVSKHNLAIDWSKVPSSGVSFVFIKAGSTNSGVDPYFDVNMRGAQAAGLKTGVYLYSYATTPEQALAEAMFLLEWMSNYTVNYPVVYDVEDACHKSLSTAQLQEIINVFCTAIASQGYYPVVYSNKNMFQKQIGNVAFDKWVAQYADELQYDGAAFWQNTSHGSVAGIPTRVDMNYQFKDYSSIIIPEGFSQRGDQMVFYSNYRMQRACWVNWEDKKYHLDENGFVQKGCWFDDETGRYFLATKDGHALRDCVTIEGADYYFDENGVMQRGLVTMPDGVVYYYDLTTGALQRNVTVTIDGVDYVVDQKGVAVPAADVAAAEAAAQAVADGTAPTADAAAQAPADGTVPAAEAAAQTPADGAAQTAQ